MPCDEFVIKDAEGNVVGSGFACSRGRRGKICQVCKQRGATKLCDFKLAGAKAGKTCDMSLCTQCAVHVGADTDYCPPHAKASAAQRDGPE